MALELCLSSSIPSERLAAQILIQRMNKMLGYKTENDYLDTQYLRKENEILRRMLPFFRHSTYCNAILDEKANCTCGYSELKEEWDNR